MTLETFEELLRTPAALAAAEALAPAEATFLKCFDALRRRFPDAIAKAALEQAILRTKAAEKFPKASTMYFEREALEQATHHLVAAQRAERYRPFGRVLDLGCGLGADAMALAAAGCTVIPVERDPLRARIARENLKNLNVIEGDAIASNINDVDAVYCDPARREATQRLLDPGDYQPDPQAVLVRFPGLPVSFKLAPGIDRRHLDSFDGEIEFVSLHGELKESRAWCRWPGSTKHRATVLPSGDTLTAMEILYDRELAGPRAFLYLPDPAVVRARLEPQLAQALNAGFLDALQPFLVSEEYHATPFAKAFAFEELISGKPRKLAEALRVRNVGRVTWRNFGSPRPVEEVRREVKLAGDHHRTVVLTKLAGTAAAMILRDTDSMHR